MDSWEDHSVDSATEESGEAILASPETSCSDVVVVDCAEIEVLSKPKIKDNFKSPVVKSQSAGRIVRPYVRTPKTPKEKPVDDFASLLQEVIVSQTVE